MIPLVTTMVKMFRALQRGQYAAKFPMPDHGFSAHQRNMAAG